MSTALMAPAPSPVPVKAGEDPKALEKAALIELLKPSLASLLQAGVHSDIETEKVRQYRMARKYDSYMRGIQYIAPMEGAGGTAQYASVGATPADGTAPALGAYDYVLNLTSDLGRKYIGVLGQKGPRVKAVADDPLNDDDVAAQTQHDLLARKHRRDWDVDLKQAELALLLYQSGTTFGYTRYVSDSEMFGESEKPVLQTKEVIVSPGGFACPVCGALSQSDVCDQCGTQLGAADYRESETMFVPDFTSSIRYPNGQVLLTLCDVTTVTTPYQAKDIRTLPWLYYQYEEHKAKLLSLYPQLRAKLKAGAGSTSFGGDANSEIGVQTRDAASSPSGVPQDKKNNRLTYTTYWLRAYMYELVEDESVRAALNEKFKRGLKIIRVGDEIVDLLDEKMDDAWSVCKPEASKFLWCDAYCRDAVAINDAINDLANIAIETLERGIPITAVDPQVFDIAAINKRAGQPAELIPVKPGQGGNIADAMKAMPVADLSEHLLPVMEMLTNRAQQIVGILPAIWGGDTGDETYRGQLLRRNQALMQLSIGWGNIKRFWEKTFDNGAKQWARFSPGSVDGPSDPTMPGMKQPTIEPYGISRGRVHYEAEETVPMTHGERRDAVTDLMAKPEAAQAIGLFDPNNINTTKDLIGFPDLVVPMADQRTAVREIIQQMLKEQPIPDTDPLTGAPKMKPSQPPDLIVFDPQQAIAVLKEWCVSAPGRALKISQNPAGYYNIVALIQAYAEAANPTPPPPPGAPPPPPGAGGPPGKPGPPSAHGNTPESGGIQTPPPPTGMPGGVPNDLPAGMPPTKQPI